MWFVDWPPQSHPEVSIPIPMPSLSKGKAVAVPKIHCTPSLQANVVKLKHPFPHQRAQMSVIWIYTSPWTRTGLQCSVILPRGPPWFQCTEPGSPVPTCDAKQRPQSMIPTCWPCWGSLRSRGPNPSNTGPGRGSTGSWDPNPITQGWAGTAQNRAGHVGLILTCRVKFSPWTSPARPKHWAPLIYVIQVLYQSIKSEHKIEAPSQAFPTIY